MKASLSAGFRRFRGGHIQKEQLLLQFERVEVGVLGAGVEAGTVLGDPREVAVTEDDGIGIVDLQAAKQVEEGVLLSGGTRIVVLAVGIETALVTDANRVGIITTGMGTDHLFGTA